MSLLSGGREDIFSGPVREGNRGGQGLFKWDTVKENPKEKDYYLGSTVKAAQGRWQKNKKLDWYHTEKEDIRKEVDVDEISEIKRLEQEAMATALNGTTSFTVNASEKTDLAKVRDEHVEFTFKKFTDAPRSQYRQQTPRIHSNDDKISKKSKKAKKEKKEKKKKHKRYEDL